MKLKVGEADVFNIVLDENGKKLGKEIAGKLVEVIGDISVKGNDL